MKRFVSFYVVLILGLGVTDTVAAQNAPAPHLVLSPDAWNFGSVWHPEAPELLLAIKNDGNAELRIGQVRSSCGCTLAFPPKRDVLQPGESTELKVRFDTSGKQGDVTSKVTIPSNDPVRPEVVLNITGHVKRAVTRAPLGGLVIRTLDGKPGQTGTVRLENQLDEPMKLQLVTKNVPDVEFEIKEVTPGKVFDVVGRTTRELPPGSRRGTVLFSTGLSRDERYGVPVQVRILSRVESVPPAIWLDPAFASTDTKRTISLQYYGTGPFEVTGVQTSDPRVTVTRRPTVPAAGGLEKLQPPVSAVVNAEASLPPASAIPPNGVTIVFTTSDPACPKVEVLVTTSREAWEAKMYGPPEEPLKTAAPPATPKPSGP